MKIWPWSRIEQLSVELRITQCKLDACGLAAAGAFHLGVDISQQKEGWDANAWSSQLMEVMKLRVQLDKYSAPPPYVRGPANAMSNRKVRK